MGIDPDVELSKKSITVILGNLHLLYVYFLLTSSKMVTNLSRLFLNSGCFMNLVKQKLNENSLDVEGIS